MPDFVNPPALPPLPAEPPVSPPPVALPPVAVDPPVSLPPVALPPMLEPEAPPVVAPLPPVEPPPVELPPVAPPESSPPPPFSGLEHAYALAAVRIMESVKVSRCIVSSSFVSGHRAAAIQGVEIVHEHVVADHLVEKVVAGASRRGVELHEKGRLLVLRDLTNDAARSVVREHVVVRKLDGHALVHRPFLAAVEIPAVRQPAVRA